MLASVKEDGWEDGEAVEGKVETPEEGEDEDGGLPGTEDERTAWTFSQNQRL